MCGYGNINGKVDVDTDDDGGGGGTHIVSRMQVGGGAEMREVVYRRRLAKPDTGGKHGRGCPERIDHKPD